jgi:uncharacterized protein
VSGETDLPTILATLEVERRPGVYLYVQAASGTPQPPGALAMVDEGATTTFVVDHRSPAAAGARFPAAWLTLTTHTALESVGLTAVVAGALAAAAIPANVLAGFDHDHLLVPVERADDAIAAIRALSGGSPAAAP